MSEGFRSAVLPGDRAVVYRRGTRYPSVVVWDELNEWDVAVDAAFRVAEPGELPTPGSVLLQLHVALGLGLKKVLGFAVRAELASDSNPVDEYGVIVVGRNASRLNYPHVVLRAAPTAHRLAVDVCFRQSDRGFSKAYRYLVPESADRDMLLVQVGDIVETSTGYGLVVRVIHNHGLTVTGKYGGEIRLKEIRGVWAGPRYRDEDVIPF